MCFGGSEMLEYVGLIYSSRQICAFCSSAMIYYRCCSFFLTHLHANDQDSFFYVVDELATSIRGFMISTASAMTPLHISTMLSKVFAELLL